MGVLNGRVKIVPSAELAAQLSQPWVLLDERSSTALEAIFKMMDGDSIDDGLLEVGRSLRQESRRKTILIDSVSITMT